MGNLLACNGWGAGSVKGIQKHYYYNYYYYYYSYAACISF